MQQWKPEQCKTVFIFCKCTNLLYATLIMVFNKVPHSIINKCFLQSLIYTSSMLSLNDL